jgi:hypothetical protein
MTDGTGDGDGEGNGMAMNPPIIVVTGDMTAPTFSLSKAPISSPSGRIAIKSTTRMTKVSTVFFFSDTLSSRNAVQSLRSLISFLSLSNMPGLP